MAAARHCPLDRTTLFDKVIWKRGVECLEQRGCLSNLQNVKQPAMLPFFSKFWQNVLVRGNSKKGKPAIFPAHSLAFFCPPLLSCPPIGKTKENGHCCLVWVDRSGKANLHFVNVSICQNALQKNMPSLETAWRQFQGAFSRDL